MGILWLSVVAGWLREYCAAGWRRGAVNVEGAALSDRRQWLGRVLVEWQRS